MGTETAQNPNVGSQDRPLTLQVRGLLRQRTYQIEQDAAQPGPAACETCKMGNFKTADE